MKMTNYKTIFLLLMVTGFFATACLDDNGEYFDPYEQLGIDTVKIDNYLTSKGIDAQVHQATGIRYVIVNEGTGEAPEDADSVVVNYVGGFIPSDSIFDENDTITFKLNRMIPGWRYGLPLVKEGGTIQLFIPSGYAYGPYGSVDRTIPPNTNLRFEVDLIEVK